MAERPGHLRTGDWRGLVTRSFRQGVPIRRAGRTGSGSGRLKQFACAGKQVLGGCEDGESPGSDVVTGDGSTGVQGVGRESLLLPAGVVPSRRKSEFPRLTFAMY